MMRECRQYINSSTEELEKQIIETNELLERIARDFKATSTPDALQHRFQSPHQEKEKLQTRIQQVEI